ncbi:MAG: hypothetical protein V9E88_15725 [Ferruginibacter sp.]
MYENKKQKLAPRTVYLKRIRKNALMAGIVLFFSLSLGVVGYKLTIPEMGWYDSSAECFHDPQWHGTDH